MNDKDDIEVIDLSEPVIDLKKSVLNPAFNLENTNDNSDTADDDIQTQIMFPLNQEEELEKTQILGPIKDEQNNDFEDTPKFSEELYGNGSEVEKVTENNYSNEYTTVDNNIQDQIHFPLNKEENSEEVQELETEKKDGKNWEYDLQTLETSAQDSENQQDFQSGPIAENIQSNYNENEYQSNEAQEIKEEILSETQNIKSDNDKSNYTFLIILFLLLLGFIIALPYITNLF